MLLNRFVLKRIEYIEKRVILNNALIGFIVAKQHRNKCSRTEYMIFRLSTLFLICAKNSREIFRTRKRRCKQFRSEIIDAFCMNQ